MKSAVKRLKNKSLQITAILLLIVVSTSCKNSHINRDTYISKEEQTINSVSKYRIIKDKFILNTTNMEMHIEYPSISDMSDIEKQERINKLIFLTSVGLYYNTYVHNKLKTNSNYTIIHNDDKYISVKYEGFTTVEARRPNYDCFCLNIDLIKGEVIGLEDVIDIEKLRVKFKKDNFTVVKGLDENIPLDESGWGELFDHYLEYHVISGDELHNYDFYFTDNKIGLIISVPVDAGGAYIILESNDNLSLADIKK